MKNKLVVMKNKILLFIVPILVIAIISIYSFCAADSKSMYFFVPFSNILTIFVAFFFAFYITQGKNDERKQKDLHEKHINKILISIDDKKMYVIKNEEDIKYIRIAQKGIKNRINLLSKQNAYWLNKDDIEYVEKEFAQYWEVISEHINDIPHLSNAQLELYNHIVNITGKLEEMLLGLYNIKK